MRLLARGREGRLPKGLMTSEKESEVFSSMRLARVDHESEKNQSDPAITKMIPMSYYVLNLPVNHVTPLRQSVCLREMISSPKETCFRRITPPARS